MSKDNSGLAFPVQSASFHAYGLTKRDHIAIAAMAAYISGHISYYGHESNHWHADSLSSEAYSMADAMLKAREAV